jgi:hypothetical protein
MLRTALPLKNLEPLNGTWMKEKKCTECVKLENNTVVILHDGDEIGFGGPPRVIRGEKRFNNPHSYKYEKICKETFLRK